MPIPTYLICSQSSSEDVASHRASLFHIVGKIQVAKTPENSDQLGMVVRLTACWLMEPGKDSPEDEFEFQLAFIFPGATERVLIRSGKFSTLRATHRVTVNGKLVVFPEVGIMRFVSRIRKVGNPEWIEHVYPVLISETPEIE